MKNKILYITIFLLFLAGLILWNNTKSKKEKNSDTITIDIDRFVENNSTEVEVNAVDSVKRIDTIIDSAISYNVSDFEQINSDSISIWKHKGITKIIGQNNSYLYIYLVRIDSNYYYRTEIQYVGKDEIGLKNIYINSNSKPKATILEVSNDNYEATKKDVKFIESVFLETNISDSIFVQDYIESDTINIVFMGFLKNVKWTLPKDQMKILQESYSYYNKLIH